MCGTLDEAEFHRLKNERAKGRSSCTNKNYLESERGDYCVNNVDGGEDAGNINGDHNAIRMFICELFMK